MKRVKKKKGRQSGTCFVRVDKNIHVEAKTWAQAEQMTIKQLFENSVIQYMDQKHHYV